ncbi:uncharacterized protein LOC130647259 [Hydractinia symbiolongicarpus]|uniref:uncharacterized protein LOC130647259 n=1 Tax=Hydractinia symbiolongicarpus TaxID=13093 RepID=UPI00254E595C|nr:uncharacterized protein LOC130647259 [Hydractinia symbiolongicarpus]XP_057309032.1 uncharacterized protein LOC130647259 [Hydractinia symbiolongicarpus]
MVDFSVHSNTIKFKRIYVGYKELDDKITSLCIQASNQNSYGIQKYNETAKWKVCFIIDPENPKQTDYIKCMQKIDARICELAKNYRHPMIKQISDNSPIKERLIPTFCQQSTKYGDGKPVRKITTPFFNRHRQQVDPAIYDGKRLSMVAAITYRDVYLSSNTIPERSLEIWQAIITGAHDIPKQTLIIDVDEGDCSEDEADNADFVDLE